jgi:hypothetical protein
MSNGSPQQVPMPLNTDSNKLLKTRACACVWLHTVPQAARQTNFADPIAATGLNVSSRPTLLEVVAAFTSAVDRHVRESGKRSDLGGSSMLPPTHSHH